MKQLVSTALSRSIVLNALRVSAVVGTALNVINQGEVVLAGHAPSWMHVALNYLVPYLVSSYSAAKNEVGRSQLPSEDVRHLQ
jgi:hypothetical protein